MYAVAFLEASENDIPDFINSFIACLQSFLLSFFYVVAYALFFHLYLCQHLHFHPSLFCIHIFIYMNSLFWFCHSQSVFLHLFRLPYWLSLLQLVQLVQILLIQVLKLRQHLVVQTNALDPTSNPTSNATGKATSAAFLATLPTVFTAFFVLFFTSSNDKPPTFILDSLLKYFTSCLNKNCARDLFPVCDIIYRFISCARFIYVSLIPPPL